MLGDLWIKASGFRLFIQRKSLIEERF